MTRLRLAPLLLFAAALLAVPSAALAQDDAEVTAAFSLSSNQAFTTSDRPSIWLTYRHTPAIDFRVYKVRDAAAFFLGLKDPHQLGTDEPQAVERTRTWLERIADWKAAQRTTVHRVLRAQVSGEYRRARRAATDTEQVQQRVTQQVRNFAQVPLLNEEQLVTSWREILPDYRDADVRRLPLDLPGPGVFVVEAVHERARAYTVVIVSDVGVVTKASPGQVLLFAADRTTGEPRAGCQVHLRAADEAAATGTTSADGLYEAALPERPGTPPLGIAVCGDQVAVSDPGSWQVEGPTRELIGWIYTDKPIYRPGHTVHVKGVLRWRTRDALQPFGRQTAEVVISDPNDKVLVRQSRPVDEFGAVTVDAPVPDSAALGLYAIRVNSGDAQATGSFEVQEYRRPEFEVVLTPESRFVVQGGEAVARVEARYYFGQPVANGRLKYTVTQRPYVSPYLWDDGFDGDESSAWYGGEQQEGGELVLDARGRGEIRVPLAVQDRPRDYSVRIDAQVTDPSRREVSGNTTVHATYGDRMVTGRLNRYVFTPGETATVSVQVLNYGGALLPEQGVVVLLERLTYPSGYYGEPTVTPVTEERVEVDRDGRRDVPMAVPREPGSYRVRLKVDAGARQAEDAVWFWVPGPAETSADATDAYAGDEYMELIADRKSYAPGETARLAVRGEAVSGPLLLTKEGQHVSWARVVRVAEGGAIELPVGDEDVGDTFVHVTWMRKGRLYQAERRLSVPAASRTLRVTVTPDRPVARPQEPGSFTVTVVDAAGAPVRAQVSLGVIDEAVYGVKADGTEDPVRVFHRREYARVGTSFSRDYHFIGFSGPDQLRLARRGRRPFSLADFKGDKEVQPQVRKDFPDAIHWVADVVTDAQGTGRVAVKYPDTLTTWRLTARAVTVDTKAGTGVTRTTTTKDLIVRVVPPRFLTEGDEVVVPTIVHNYREEARTASVRLEARGVAPAAAAPTPTSAAVPAGGARQDDWRFRAASPGTATFTTTARTETDTDAVELSLPVVPYGVAQERGASGVIAAGGGEATQELTIPATANPSGSRIRIAVAPSLGGAVLGALDFLTSYPYGCTEQTLSSFVPTLVTARTLGALQLPRTEALGAVDRQVSSGLRRLYDLQHDDGGWGWWRSDGNHPFMTAYALAGLAEARAGGHRVDSYRVDQGVRSLVSQYLDTPDMVPDLKVFVVRVLGLALADDEDGVYTVYRDGQSREYAHAAALDGLWTARGDMTIYGKALLALALHDRKDARAAEATDALVAAAQSRGGLAWWQGDDDPLLFQPVDTSVEVTSMAVQALAQRDPSHALLPRAVRWLLANRRGGYWASTKQTALAVEGLLAYMRASGVQPAATVDVAISVNGTPAGTRRFTGADLTLADPVTFAVPGAVGTNTVRVTATGSGTLHWTATAEYVDTARAAARQGSRELALTRKYFRLVPVTARTGSTVYREVPFEGTARPGDVLAVRLTLAGASDWRYLMLTDPLPAGTEAIQDDTPYPLETPGTAYASQVEYRDQKTVIFREHLDAPRLEYVYLLKVVAAGTFRASPASVAPMYIPDVTASSEPFTLTVTPDAAGEAKR